MAFMASVAFLSWANLLTSQALISRQRWLSLGHFAVGLVGAALPIYGLGAYLGVRQSVGGANPAVWLALVFGFGSLLLALGRLAKLIQQGGDNSPGGWRLGTVLWCCLASLFLCWAVADHALFIRGSRIAVVDLAALEVRDATCEGYAIARIDDGAISRYRCANSFVWGPFSDAPFIPWPSYAERTSADLQPALQRMMAQARHAGD